MRQKIAAALLMLMALVGVAAAVGGSAEDPLISVSYWTGTYTPQVATKLTARAAAGTEKAYQTAVEKLEQMVASRALVEDDGMNHSTEFTTTQVKRGDAMDFTSGSSVLMLEGRIHLAAGVLVDTTEGAQCKLGDPLKPGHTYLAAGSGKTTVTAISDMARLAPCGAYAQRISSVIATPFSDLAEIDWFYGAIRYSYQGGLFNGTSATQFTPNGNMTRAMLATVLHRLAGEPKSGAHSFEDVKEGTWYTEPVAWAASVGIVQGMSEGMFEPDGLITREQMAVMLYRYAGQFLKQDVTARAALSGFTDGDKVSPWAKEAMEWAAATEVVTGRNSGEVDPHGPATRAEVATMLKRFSILISVG